MFPPKYQPEALFVILILQLLTQTSIGQVTDGDEQFLAYHQDIGRISTSSSSSPVAPQTIVRQMLQPVVGESAIVVASAPQQTSQRSRQAKPNRITLAVRTSAPIQVSADPSGPLEHFKSSHLSSLSSELASASATVDREPKFSTQYESHQPQAQNHFQQAASSVAEQQQPAGPALSSFRSAANSGSARHAALIAQVAAERQAATNDALDFPLPTATSSQQQPSLGSPLEALSSPAISQVQPPPTLQAPVASAASAATTFVDKPEEPLVAPSFEHVMSKGCPHKGVFSYENKDHCDRYYMCTNGTFTEEACPNGLAYSQMGAVYQHCAYNWNVNCGNKKTAEPLASPGCPWQFGIFPVSGGGRCSIDYFVCEWGVPETKRCTPEGLFYDDRIKGCQWADQLGCKSEALLNFKCPAEDEDNPYWPFPRYYHTKKDVIVCVNEQPRLVHCNEEQLVDPSSLACLDIKKKKKKL